MKRRVNPESGVASNFVMLDSPDWVNIVPLTEDNKIVMVEQYRHGSDEITLELPGGMVEHGEEYLHAAMRECMEETGYEGTGLAVEIGRVKPNPAFLNNHCTTFLWKNCKLTREQKLDSNELIKIKTFAFDEIKDMIKSGKINHAIILNAFFFFSLHLDNYNG
ncbi:MAG: NUDIX hydrolase [Candidatus Kapaibacterium sp.]